MSGGTQSSSWGQGYDDPQGWTPKDQTLNDPQFTGVRPLVGGRRPCLSVKQHHGCQGQQKTLPRKSLHNRELGIKKRGRAGGGARSVSEWDNSYFLRRRSWAKNIQIPPSSQHQEIRAHGGKKAEMDWIIRDLWRGRSEQHGALCLWCAFCFIQCGNTNNVPTTSHISSVWLGFIWVWLMCFMRKQLNKETPTL